VSGKGQIQRFLPLALNVRFRIGKGPVVADIDDGAFEAGTERQPILEYDRYLVSGSGQHDLWSIPQGEPKEEIRGRAALTKCPTQQNASEVLDDSGRVAVD